MNSHPFPYAVWRLLTATGLSNWTTDANEGSAVGGLSTVQKGKVLPVVMTRRG